MGITYSWAGRFKAVLLLLMVVALATGCAKKEEQKKDKKPVPVVTAEAGRRDVPVILVAIGNVEPSASVSVKSMVTGEITGVNFTEGQDVRRGALLFTVDPRPIEAELRRAEGVMSRSSVQAANAQADANRYAGLFDKGMVSKQQYDQAATAYLSLAETVKTDKAAVDAIKVQLGYTKIYSPIDGRTGDLMVDRGNIIKANDTPSLVVINKIRPVFVSFSVPEKYLPVLQSRKSGPRITVTATVKGVDGPPAEGYLSFIDNAVDPATGSIRLKATFDNKAAKLWPGQFVDVSLILDTLHGATVVDSHAILTGQQGPYVFVVKPDSTVEARPVTIGVTRDGWTVVEKGLAPGETVVTDGQMKLTPGARVSAGKAKEAQAAL